MSGWLWEGLIHPGAVTLLAGFSKSGKTTLLEGLLRAMERGVPFLGLPTSPATAVVVSEEPRFEFDYRDELLGPAPERAVIPSPTSLRLDWRELVQRAVDEARAGGHDLIVFDSFSVLSGLEEEPELLNDASATLSRLKPLKTVEGIEDFAVVFVHHLGSKGQLRGATAIRDFPETNIRLHRRSVADNAFELRSEGRYPKTPAYLRGRLRQDAEPWTYEALDARSSRGHRQAVLDAIDAATPEGWSLDEIVRESGVKARKTVERIVVTGYGDDPGLLSEGRVVRTGAGKARDPYRYRPAEKTGTVRSVPHTHTYLESPKDGDLLDPSPPPTAAGGERSSPTTDRQPGVDRLGDGRPEGGGPPNEKDRSVTDPQKGSDPATPEPRQRRAAKPGSDDFDDF